jgi:hypothetical protein
LPAKEVTIKLVKELKKVREQKKEEKKTKG